MKIKTLKQARNKGLLTLQYGNGDWKYRDEDGYIHLFRNDIELTKGIKAIAASSHYNGDWRYEEERGEVHFIENNHYGLIQIDNRKKYYCPSCNKIKNFIPENEKIGLYFCKDCGEIYGNKHFQTLFSNS